MKRLLFIITIVALVALPFLNSPKVTIESSNFLSIGTDTVLAAEEEELVESVWMRTKNSKVFHSYGVPNRDYHDIYLDAIHYEVGYEREVWVDNVTTETIYWTTWEDINNTLEPAGDLSPWDWQMVKADYHIYILEDFTYGQILKFEKADPYGTVLGDVTFQPMALQWTNDLDQVQEVSMPQSGVLSVVDNKIEWADAYGLSIDFSWTCASTRLLKLLTIDSLSNLPIPEQYVLDGGNPVLRLDFIFDPSSKIDIYIDGNLWDKKSDVQTFGTIEFQLGGETLWGFMPLWIWDSTGNELSVVQKLERVGGKLFVSVRVPYEWIQTATFPIYIDATVDEWVETSTDDADELVSDGSMDLTNTVIDLGSYTGGATHAGFRFTGIDTADVEEVSTAYLEFYSTEDDSGGVSYTWYGENTANATTFTTDAFDISNRAKTTASVTENPPADWISDTLVQTPDLSNILNEIFSGESWVSGNDLAILNIYNSGNGERRTRSWDYNDHSKAPKLHFENPTEVTYYFDVYDVGNAWDNDHAYMCDGILTNYAYTASDGDKQYLRETTGPGTDLGTITKVEIRAYAYGDGDDRIDFAFISDMSTEYQTTPGTGPPGTWGSYVDVTDDPYIVAEGGWTWAKVQSPAPSNILFVEFDKVGKGNTMYCAKVEIRVTYWVPPVADIDVGAAPIDRPSNASSGFTYIAKDNTANASGVLHSVKIWAAVNIENLVVGTFYPTNGNTLKCRDSEAIGNVTAGSEQTFTELSITVVENDYIGCYYTSGALEMSTTGGAGTFWVIGEYIDPGDETVYGSYPNYAGSLYGYGDVGACSPNISNTPVSYDFGIVNESANYTTNINYFTVTNNSGGTIDISIQGTDMTGGVTWTLSDTATPGTNTYGLKCGLDDADDLFDIIVKKNTPYNDLVTGLADTATQDWGLQLLAPSSMTDGDEKTGTVTLTATCQ